MAWLLDPNVQSELRKPQPSQSVVTFITSEPLLDLYVSIVSLAEIRFGIELVSDPVRRFELGAWLSRTV